MFIHLEEPSASVASEDPVVLPGGMVGADLAWDVVKDTAYRKETKIKTHFFNVLICQTYSKFVAVAAGGGGRRKRRRRLLPLPRLPSGDRGRRRRPRPRRPWPNHRERLRTRRRARTTEAGSARTASSKRDCFVSELKKCFRFGTAGATDSEKVPPLSIGRWSSSPTP